jgi:hypothetical protein
MTKVGITITCQRCNKEQPMIEIDHWNLVRWRDGFKIQDAMPDLTPGQRELIISGTCEKCFDEMFPKGE